MPGYILHQGAQVFCMHAGTAQPMIVNPRVTVSGQPIVTQTCSYAIAGCPFVPPAGNGPCVTAQWITGATRVRAGGTPVLLQDSLAVSVPTGTGLNILMTQTRAKGV